MTTDPSARCVLGDPNKAHRAHVGYLCDSHLQRLAADLRQVEELAVELAARPAGIAYRSGAAGGGRGGALASQRSQLDLTREALIGRTAADFDGADAHGWDDTPNVVDQIGSWAAMVREQRGIAACGGSLTADRDLLSRQLGWIAEQPWVDELAAEVGELVTALRRAIPGMTRADEGTCPVIVEGSPCGGRLRRMRGATPWLLMADRCQLVPVDVHAGPLECPACGTTWLTSDDEAELRSESRRLALEALRPVGGDGRGLRTARELADDHGLTLRSVQLRLHRAAITPVMDRGMGWYPPDAIASRVNERITS